MFRNKMQPKWLRDLLERIAHVSLAPDKPIVRQHRKLGRNERCRCGCGKKYRSCCWSNDVRYGVR